MRLELDTGDINGKPYTGAEVQSLNWFSYGTYEVEMKASGESGVNSSFFVYTGPYFGDPWNEVDFEFLGKDPTKVSLAYHNDGHSFSKWVDLPFDSSQGYHTYSFDWEPDRIAWYADGELLYEATSATTGVAIPDHPSKMIMNIWTGMNGWLGTPDFDDSTSASYRGVSYTPYSPSDHEEPGEPEQEGVDLNLFLMNAEDDSIIGQLTDGASIALPQGAEELSVVAVAADGSSDEFASVTFALDGAMHHDKTENISPYALFGDLNGDLKGQTLGAGNYDLEVKAFSASNGNGAQLFRESINFTLEEAKDSSPTLLLVDARTDLTIMELTDGTVIERDDLPHKKFSIVIQPVDADETESIRFDLTGEREHHKVESIEPYAMFGDHNGNIRGGLLLWEGNYSLALAMFSENAAQGNVLSTFELDFQIV